MFQNLWFSIYTVFSILQIFDMKEFKSHMAIEMSKRKPHMEILQPRSIVALSFVKNTIDDMDTPCWIILINFLALNALQDQRGKYKCKSCEIVYVLFLIWSYKCAKYLP